MALKPTVSISAALNASHAFGRMSRGPRCRASNCSASRRCSLIVMESPRAESTFGLRGSGSLRHTERHRTRLCHRCERQANREYGAHARATARGDDAATVQLDDLVHDRQPEPGATGAHALGAHALHLPRGIEEMGQRIGRDPDAVVAHDELGVVLAAVTLDDDIASGGRASDRVREQIVHDLLETLGVRLEWTGTRVDERLEPYTLCARDDTHRIHLRIDD